LAPTNLQPTNALTSITVTEENAFLQFPITHFTQYIILADRTKGHAYGTMLCPSVCCL